jgi:YD repeat-containing protein
MPFFMVLAACVLAGSPALADTVTYTYDANGRLLGADYGGGNRFTYTYDKTDNLLTVTSTSADNTLRVSISPAGNGTVTGTGISCPTDCAEAFTGTQPASLTANAQAGFQPLGWSGDVVSTTNPVNFTMDADKNVASYFGAIGGATDGDGVLDSVEWGPSGYDYTYDGDGNGVPDYQEAGAVSLPTAAGGGYATVAVPAPLTLADVQAVANPSPGDAPPLIIFPFGFFQFTVNGLTAGACTQATLFLPPSPSIATHYKYGPEPGNATPHWYEFLKSGATGAAIYQEATRTRVVLDVCDGQRGDADLTANGQIFDPGAPGERLPTPTRTATSTRTRTPTRTPTGPPADTSTPSATPTRTPTFTPAYIPPSPTPAGGAHVKPTPAFRPTPTATLRIRTAAPRYTPTPYPGTPGRVKPTPSVRRL